MCMYMYIYIQGLRFQAGNCFSCFWVRGRGFEVWGMGLSLRVGVKRAASWSSDTDELTDFGLRLLGSLKG